MEFSRASLAVIIGEFLKYVQYCRYKMMLLVGCVRLGTRLHHYSQRDSVYKLAEHVNLHLSHLISMLTYTMYQCTSRVSMGFASSSESVSCVRRHRQPISEHGPLSHQVEHLVHRKPVGWWWFLYVAIRIWCFHVSWYVSRNFISCLGYVFGKHTNSSRLLFKTCILATSVIGI